MLESNTGLAQLVSRLRRDKTRG